MIAWIILSSPIWLYRDLGVRHARPVRQGRRWGRIFLDAAIPLFGIGIGIMLCYLSLGLSMHFLLGLTPGGVQT